MIKNKGTLYWSRGCVAETGKEGEITSCKAVKNCHKLTVYNWLRNIPADREYDIFEVRFKNTRKGFYRNVNNIDLKESDIVAVEASPGHDIGIISALGPVAEIKFLKSNPDVTDTKLVDLKKIYRIARPVDIEKWQEAVSLEYTTMIQARKIASSLKLNMKIGDVDFQGDRTKAIFYYIADERVDFRELIKIMAETFKLRIEMRQIGARQEAGLIGGIGPCGRELCCAQWMRNFVSVSTNSVRHQEISVNPLKLAGQCSKLKCCLNYELDTYLDAWDAFPKVRQLETVNGTIFLQKTDVLKGILYFAAAGSPQLFPIPVEKVKEMIDGNKKGEKSELYINTNEIDSGFKSAVGEDSLTRFDQSKRRRKNKKKIAPNNSKPQENPNLGKPQENTTSNKPQENTTPNKPQGNATPNKPQRNANSGKQQGNANPGRQQRNRNRNNQRNSKNQKNGDKNQS
jgi:cell fate regulator YaaT (PSP1 superfamily)